MSERSDRRGRNLLKSYYGLGKGDAPKADPLDLDAQDFDPDMFFRKMMAEKDLPELIKEDNKIVAETRTLDGDMKTLVYDNYSKFISATDTIKKMKQNVDNMDEEMNKLRLNMNKISEGSAKINTSLVEKRDKIGQLSGVHGLLKKLQFVFELPAKLRKCLDMQAYAQAYKYYMKTTDILKHYNHLPSFANIQAESDQIIRELVVKLKKKLVNEATRSNELSECVEILLGLKESPEKLWKDYLQFQLRELKKSLKASERECENLKPEVKKKPKAPREAKKEPAPDKQAFDESDDDASSVQSDQTNATSSSKLAEPQEEEEEEEVELFVDPSRKLDILNNIFLKEFAAFVASFVNLFMQPSGKAKLLTEENLKLAEQDLLHVVDEISQLYFAAVEKNCLALSTEPKMIPTPYHFVALLGKMFKEINTLDAIAPHARLIARNKSQTSNFLLGYSNAMFGFVESKAKEFLNKIVSQLPLNKDSLNVFVKPFCVDLLENVKTYLSNLEVFLQSGAKFMGEHTLVFTHDIIRRSSSFLNSLLKTFEELSSKPQASTTSFDALPLVLSKIALEFEGSVSSNFFLYIADTFSTGGRKAVASEAKEAIKNSKESAQRILANFVEQTGQKCTLFIRTFVETRNWMSKKEPRKVSDVWRDMMNDLTSIQKAAEQLFPDESKPKAGSESSRTGSRRDGPRGHAKVNPLGNHMMSNIDKLFSDNIEIFGAVEFKKASIVTAILKIIVKTTSESLRMCTFSRTGFQQIQVDIEFLRVHFWRFVTDEGLFNRLLDDVINSAQTRCVDPVPLEHSIVQKLANEMSMPGAE